MVQKKICTQCGNSFPATPEYFYRDKGYADGLHCHCKSCRNAYNRERRKKNPEREREQGLKRQRRWLEKEGNRELTKQRQRKYYERKKVKLQSD